MINLIVAMGKNNVIGIDNKLPWRLPKDLEYFKETTLNHSIVMGRKTFQSLPGILPGRNHIVLTRSGMQIRSPFVRCYGSVDEVLELSKSQDLFVIGGEEIFKQFLPFVDRMFITYIDEHFEGDTFFPKFNEEDWELVSVIKGIKDEKNPYDYEFRVYEILDI